MYYFPPILAAGAFSYSVGGQVFRKENPPIMWGSHQENGLEKVEIGIVCLSSPFCLKTCYWGTWRFLCHEVHHIITLKLFLAGFERPAPGIQSPNPEVPRKSTKINVESKAWALLIKSGKKRNPNLNFWVRISSGGVVGLPPAGVGAKSSACPSKPRENKLFGFCRDIPELPEKFEEKKLVFNFWPLLRGSSPQG